MKRWRIEPTPVPYAEVKKTGGRFRSLEGEVEVVAVEHLGQVCLEISVWPKGDKFGDDWENLMAHLDPKRTRQLIDALESALAELS